MIVICSIFVPAATPVRMSLICAVVAPDLSVFADVQMPTPMRGMLANPGVALIGCSSNRDRDGERPRRRGGLGPERDDAPVDEPRRGVRLGGDGGAVRGA